MLKKKRTKREQPPIPKPQEVKRQRRPKDSAFGRLKGKIQILGDIVAPVTPIEDWEALKE